MELDELNEKGRREAERWMLAGEERAGRFCALIRADLRAIGGLCRRLTPRREQKSSAALEWLLENRYLAEYAGHEAIRSIRRAPKLALLKLDQNRFRVQHIGFLLSELEHFDEDHIGAFLSGVQEVQPLTEEELALIPEALAAGLVARYRRYGEQAEQLLADCSDPVGLTDALRQTAERLAELRRMDLGKMLEELSMVDRFFRQDPSGVYPKMDAYSRQAYRTRLCRLAGKQHMSQTACAQQLLELAKDGTAGDHIGIYLFRRPLGWEERPIQSGWYVSLITLPTTVGSIGIGFALGRWWAILLFLLPVSELVKNTVDLLLLHFRKPRPVFRMELKDGVPPHGKTLCVIASLLTGEDSVSDLTSKLERYALANRRAGDQVCYGLLADLPDRNREMNAQDEALIQQTVEALEGLNKAYGRKFYLFFRKPVYVPGEGTYRGRERKRGAILQLVRYLRGRRGEIEVLAGEEEGLRGTQFLLALDSDTILTMDAVLELAGTMLHPLNTPEVDTRRRVVTSGYGILQPRVETELSSADRSIFARLFSGIGGLDPYGGAVSDLYHDLFDQATFLGKGLIHIDAFLACMDGRFPENRILSHDLLEGSYLRCGWISRTELMDGFPSSALSWLTRYHRWIRGDWQIAAWLGKRVRDEKGNLTGNPITPLAKWKIFDNLRRSLVPPATAAALTVGLLGTGPLFLAALLAALLTALSQLVTAAVEFAWRRGQAGFRRFHSGIYSGFSGSAIRSGADLLFLPVQSWTALNAVYLALWRMAVGHKHLLDWVTSSQSSQGKQGLASYGKRFMPSLLLGFGAMVFSLHWMGRMMGLAWAVSPLLFFKWGRGKETKADLPRRDRAFLLHEAALIWRYYEDYLQPEYHYLIPDNVQSMPDQGAAPRTSPTNLGLALLSCLGALDLKLTSREAAVEKIRLQLETMEKLERWHGHFYNWYEIRTCKLLRPRYISTVDSGNLCADLITLTQGLKELEEHDLARRAEQLAAEMDFSALFDPRQMLFYIGYDAENHAYSKGHYDLMASEARITSYLAIARGEVPPRHWRNLSRGIVRRNRYIGMASWSGTMFEYLMPQLLLPVYPDSAWGETLSFCVDQQRREGERTGLPWGISESGFYALDLRQNFQYKAHGVPALTLRNELTRERVIAPYASYLALLVQPHAAIANLRKIRDLGGEGTYGLYEALDFTASRGGSRKSPLMVASWMAHHQGMSLLALDNCLNDSPMVRRFLSDPQMMAAQELLQEKIPVGDAVLRPEPALRIPEPRTGAMTQWRRSGTGWDPADPVWGIVANEGYAVLLSAAGTGESKVGSCTILHPDGIQIALRQGDTTTRIFPLRGADERLRWDYRSGQAEFTWQDKGFSVSQCVTVDASCKGERRSVTVEAREDLKATLCILARPVLSEWEAYAAHPAFSRMCVESKYIGSGVQFVRRPGRGKAAPVLTALWSEQDAGWTTNRERYLVDGSISHTGREGTVLDPCLALELPLKLSKGQRKTLNIAFATGSTKDSLRCAQALLGLRKPTGAPLTNQLAMTLGLETVNAALVLLSRLRGPRQLGQEGTVLGQASLWPFAISGDLPIVTLQVQPQEQKQAMELAAVHRFLARMGIAFDLVLLLPEEGDYFQTIRNTLTRKLQDQGWGDGIDAGGGIHLISGRSADWQPILGMASLNLRPGDALEQGNQFQSSAEQIQERRLPLPEVQWHWQENSFVLENRGNLPKLRWSHLLVNAVFGWRCDEAGTGHLWYKNAQLGQITGWQNDPIAAIGPEQLHYRWEGDECSLFAAKDGYPAVVTYGPGYARWEKTLSGRKVTLTAFVPWNQPVRVWKIQMDGAEPADRIQWRFEPRLSQQRRHAPWVQWRHDGNTVTFSNPAGTMPGVGIELTASQGMDSLAFTDGMCTMTFTPSRELLLTVGVAGEGSLNGLSPIEAADRALTDTVQWWTKRTAGLQVRTPDTGINHYLSFWGPYQVLAGRVLGRNGLYQCGGAIGFRDQLQDVLSMTAYEPELVRSQIRQAAAHQFREGDVLHWWHPTLEPGAALGVRTRISDDLLWLPYALCRWVEETGDSSLLSEQASYLEGSPLQEEETERYDRWQSSSGGESIYRHAVQAIEWVLNRGVGAHGLCRIGAGDWNDGMNHLGIAGKGESVWLTWFLALVLERFAPLCAGMEEGERAQRYEKLVRQLTASAQQAWDGGWYLRAYDDEGRSIGSSDNRECAIDSIAQSFAVFAPNSEEKRSRQAVLSTYEMLYDREHQLIRLLRPPFSGDSNPGYIRAYPEGLRENGGQYTHAACWLAMALLRAGEEDKAYELLHDLLPEHHPTEQYRGEPYVLAGDVYAAEDQQGRCGWSWYTGAAGWYCQCVTRDLLGLRLEGGVLFIRPNLPSGWQGYEADWKGEKYELHITVSRGEAPEMRLDGKPWQQGIPLNRLKGCHNAQVVIP